MTSHNRNGVALLVALGVVAAALPVLAQRAPAAAPSGVDPSVLSLACAPSLSYEMPFTPLHITGSQESTLRRSMAPGDLITINAGTKNGIEVGQEFFARRPMPINKRAVSRDNPTTISTTGWIRVYAVDDEMSLATVTYACDALALGDYLEPFVLPEVPTPSPDRPKAQRGNYGRVLSGSDNRAVFGKGDYFIVDRGSDHGVTPGANFVVYRDKLEAGNFLFELGEAVAVTVRPDTSTLRVTLSRDALTAGDFVAIRK